MRKLAIIAIMLILVSASAVVAADNIDTRYIKITQTEGDYASTAIYYAPPGEQGRVLAQEEITKLPPEIVGRYVQVRSGMQLPDEIVLPTVSQPAQIATRENIESSNAALLKEEGAQAPGEEVTPSQQVTEAGEGAPAPGEVPAAVGAAGGAGGQGAAQLDINNVRIIYNGNNQFTYLTTDEMGEPVELTEAQIKQLQDSDAETWRDMQQAAEESATGTVEYSWGDRLGNFVQSYRIYSGLQGYSSLIFDKEFLANWRNRVNDIFCNKVLGYLPLSRDCWTSTVCGIYTEITPPQDGVLFTAPVGGLPAVAAHIEGERSLPIVTPSQTSWVYKVTFSVTNPLDETLKINVYFQSAEKKAAWWAADQEIGEGNTFAAVGASALMKLSPTDYTSVCLSFSPSLEAFGGRRTGSICNSITQYAGAATMPYAVTTGTETAAQPGATTPAAPTTPGASI
jgi:hypothetical protein